MIQSKKLPKGWAWAQWSQIGSSQNGRAFPSSEYQNDGIKLLRPGNLHVTGRVVWTDKNTQCMPEQWAIEFPEFIVGPNELVINLTAQSLKDDFLGRVCMTGPTDRCLLNQRIARLTPVGVKTKYLLWMFKSDIFRRFVDELNTGSLIQHMFTSQLAEFCLPVPPLEEQDRIVAEIEKQLTRIDTGIDVLKRLQANLKRYRASVLKAACEGKLVPTEAELARAEGRDYEPADKLLARILKERRARWEADQLVKLKAKGQAPRDDEWKGKYEAPTDVSAAGLPSLPEGWARASLRAVADIKGGITKGQKRREADVLRSVPYLRVANVQRGYLDLCEMKEIEATDQEIEDLRLQYGDVLFNEGGDRDKLGRGCIWRDELPLCIHQNHVFRARTIGRTLDPRIISWYGNTFGQRYFIDEGKQTTNLASINLTKLGAFPVPLPPEAEQKRIIAEVDRRLSVADETLGVINLQLARANRLRQAVLKRAFEGKLVPQDPNDEPASILLERIRAERATEPERKNTRGRKPRATRAKLQPERTPGEQDDG